MSQGARGEPRVQVRTPAKIFGLEGSGLISGVPSSCPHDLGPVTSLVPHLQNGPVNL